MPLATKSPALFIASTSQEQALMKQGFIDRMIYKLVFKPIQINTFHKTSEYLLKKILCQPFIHLDTTNFIYLNHVLANEAVWEMIKKIKHNLLKKGEEDYLGNQKFMNTLRIAIRDSRNLNRLSKYQYLDKQEILDESNVKKVDLWYFK